MIGTITFVISVATIAMKKEYELLGVYIVGMVSAFRGGALRNILIGVPIYTLWGQGNWEYNHEPKGFEVVFPISKNGTQPFFLKIILAIYSSRSLNTKS
jgi:hypothetical protein